MSEIRIHIELENGESKTSVINIEKDMVYSELLNLLLSKEKLPDAEYQFFLQRNGALKLTEIKAESYVRPPSKDEKILLKVVPFAVTVQHLGLQCNIKIRSSDTSSDVLRKFGAEVNEIVDCSVPLSFKGMRINETDSMKEVGVVTACIEKLNSSNPDKMEVSLSGALKVWVEDSKAGHNIPIEVFPYETIEEVMRKYCSAQGRNYVLGSSLCLGNAELKDHQTVFGAKPAIQDDCSLKYRASDYEIEIKDSAAENEMDAQIKGRITQRVEDHWTVKQLRKEYSARPEVEHVSEKDTFFLEETALNDTVQLYRLGLGPDSTILLRRAKAEDFNLYNCAECGEELKLKAMDAVRCKYCFYRVVYKKRTPNSCQYNCR